MVDERAIALTLHYMVINKREKQGQNGEFLTICSGDTGLMYVVPSI
jgi:hypothetical protein